MSIPLFNRTGLIPSFSIASAPYWTIALARTVAVVVPSPTLSLVLNATFLIKLQASFSTESFN